MTIPSAIFTGNIVDPDPIETFWPIMVGNQSFGAEEGVPLLKTSLVKVTPWPMKQESPISTREQINE
jgi:hypothetical protein